MKTYIRTAHEEEFSTTKKVLGIFINLDEEGARIDSLAYIYHKGIYIFFRTIIEMNDYLLYGETKHRAYITEEDFDVIYDADYIDGKFADQLTWMNEISQKNLSIE